MASIVAATGNAKVSLYVADFSLLASVSKVVDALLADFPVIDVLCNNAGGANGPRTVTAEGFETTFVTNHLSGFLLMRKLLGRMLGEDSLESRAGPAPTGVVRKNEVRRVVFTSSYGHNNSALDFDDLNLEKDYTTLKAYGRSKLMNLLTARELQRRYGDRNIVASSFHPGAVRTPIWGKGGSVGRFLGIAMYPFMVSIAKGADTFIWLASSQDEASVNASGHYFYKRGRPRTAAFATDEAAAKLWQVSERLIEPYLSARS
ncbi:MAG: SDR family NAD(P)-dependent oxidoreductase [Gammaproteobacteria bacterium]|nr:SDR family NAD(P)-dependent oxidoreductase [Gammaproteobacteria bacterium]